MAAPGGGPEFRLAAGRIVEVFMDYQVLQLAYGSLPLAAQVACAKAGVAVLGKVLGGAWSALTPKDLGAAFAGIYRQWREGLLDSAVDDEKLSHAFEDFFCRPPTIRELDKLLRDQYQELDFDVLAQMFRESCHFAGCPLPESELHAQLETWVESLEASLGQAPDYRQKYQLSVQRAVENLHRAEPGLRNFSLARHAYVRELVNQHRLVQFRGFAEIGGPVEVELAKVFVMPRVAAQDTGREAQSPVPAENLLKGKRAAARIVVLGKPGSGKTTLLEYFALALASRSSGYPDLLPVFYRVRHLEEDLRRHPGGGVWECLHAHCAQRLSLDLPAGFFRRHMAKGGLLILLDGLDEVASEGRRIELVDLVSAFAHNLPATSRVVITSRPHEYARSRFASDACRHYQLCEFNDEEIRKFIDGWRELHERNRAAAPAGARDLWRALERAPRIKELAHNALLLTMIVRVHWGLGQLPESRLDLYAKCSDTLLKHWAVAANLGEGPVGLEHKRRFLAQLAYGLQESASPDELAGEVSLQIRRTELVQRLEQFLRDQLGPQATSLAEPLIEKLHARDAILVNYGGDQFGFVHRSFQEYFAACWMAQRKSPADYRGLLDRPGWTETLYLAVAQLRDVDRQPFLLDLLRESRVEFAVGCLRAGPPQERWLQCLVQFLARCTPEGSEYAGVSAAESADSLEGHSEVMPVLSAMFQPERREGRALAAAVELAEELSRRGDAEARRLLESFFAEAVDLPEDMVLVEAGAFPYGEKARPVHLGSFHIDRYLVTNQGLERMVPGHRALRDGISDADDQPVIYVNWHEARLYARWRGRGRRLPTEQEWEKAAAWDAANKKKRTYPWGDQFEPSRANTGEGGPSKTTPVGAYPQGKSACGCHDMAGNVWEWTESLWSQEQEERFRVLRGGAWYFDRGGAACSCRLDVHPQNRFYGVGFRCART